MTGAVTDMQQEQINLWLTVIRFILLPGVYGTVFFLSIRKQYQKGSSGLKGLKTFDKVVILSAPFVFILQAILCMIDFSMK